MTDEGGLRAQARFLIKFTKNGTGNGIYEIRTIHRLGFVPG
jgi:hypothetical protein